MYNMKVHMDIKHPETFEESLPIKRSLERHIMVNHKAFQGTITLKNLEDNINLIEESDVPRLHQGFNGWGVDEALGVQPFHQRPGAQKSRPMGSFGNGRTIQRTTSWTKLWKWFQTSWWNVGRKGKPTSGPHGGVHRRRGVEWSSASLRHNKVQREAVAV